MYSVQRLMNALSQPILVNISALTSPAPSTVLVALAIYCPVMDSVVMVSETSDM